MNTYERPDTDGDGSVATAQGGETVPDLVTFNATLIDAGCALLERLDDHQYASAIDSLSDSSVGGHIRHCIDFYEALLHGADDGTVDYDTRPREALLEQDRKAAIGRLAKVKAGIEGLVEADLTRLLSVRVTTPAGRSEDVPSSLARELETAANHTIHHYAIIAIFARARGLEVDRSFGVALSTRRYRAAQESRQG